VSVLPEPDGMVAGLAVSEAAFDGLVTVTVAVAVTAPAEFVAVSV